MYILKFSLTFYNTNHITIRNSENMALLGHIKQHFTLLNMLKLTWSLMTSISLHDKYKSILLDFLFRELHDPKET